MDCLKNIDVVVLAGGFGTRLRDVLPDRPKALAPVAGRPFLSYLVEQVKEFGANRIILALGTMAQRIEEYFSQNVEILEVVTSVEKYPLGTGGGLRRALRHIRSKTVLVMNGDSFTRVDLCRFLKFHKSRQARVSVLLTYRKGVDRFGMVHTDGEDEVKEFLEGSPTSVNEGFVNSGVYFFDRSVIGEIPEDRFISLESEIFPSLLGRGFFALKGDFPFMDIGTPESYRSAGSFFLKETASDH